ncbi:hypothetical protein GLOIN_2v1769092 [Rhizophagus irregularis DAOM 181602=DAOM 197198]|nr:hypothetical protein GLOIN_2v1769092 [Rhizophagus irregularis DAOM 181602=DAOM 197198]
MRQVLDKVVTNHPEEITNSTVKKYLKKQDFYDKVNTLAKLLRPIKNAILMLEGNQTNLADAFIQMIRLAASNIWKAMGNNSKSCEDLFLQMRQYKLKLVPYKEEFRNNDETKTLNGSD